MSRIHVLFLFYLEELFRDVLRSRTKVTDEVTEMLNEENLQTATEEKQVRIYFKQHSIK